MHRASYSSDLLRMLQIYLYALLLLTPVIFLAALFLTLEWASVITAATACGIVISQLVLGRRFNQSRYAAMAGFEIFVIRLVTTLMLGVLAFRMWGFRNRRRVEERDA